MCVFVCLYDSVMCVYLCMCACGGGGARCGRRIGGCGVGV